jgi:hypothetical protein
MTTWKRRRRTAAIALSAALLAAPAASARLDEGAATNSGGTQTAVRVVDAGEFSWNDAGIGAGAALSAVLLTFGAGLAVRKRSLPAPG